MPTRPERDEILMIDPVPLPFIAFKAKRQPRKQPSVLTACTARQSASEAFWGSCGPGEDSNPVIPALLTSTSISGWACWRRSHCASSRTSSSKKSQANAAAEAAPSTASMSVRMTLAPSHRNASQIPRPIPRAPPVTTHSLSFNFRINTSVIWSQTIARVSIATESEKDCRVTGPPDFSPCSTCLITENAQRGQAHSRHVVDPKARELAVERRATDAQPPCNLGHASAIMADGEADDVRLDILERAQIAILRIEHDANAVVQRTGRIDRLA